MKDNNSYNTTILPDAQKVLLKELHETPKDFVLYGGTALALRFGHRISVDFDFFSNTSFDPQKLYKSIEYLHGSKIQQLDQNTLTCTVMRGKPIQVSFFGGLPLGCVQPPSYAQDFGIHIASALDIGAAKMRVIIMRPSWKDYVDIDQLLQKNISIEKMVSAALSLYELPYSPLLSMKALTFFSDLGPELSNDARDRITRAAQKVNMENIKKLPICKSLIKSRSRTR